MEEEKKFDNFFDKFVYLFILFSPILDALTSIFVRNTNLPFSIGTIIRGIFLLFVLIWLKNKGNCNKILLVFLLYAFLALMYFMGIYHLTFFNEINNIFQIFYLPIMLLFFSKYENDKINEKLIVNVYFIYLNLIIIPFLFNIGYNLSESYSNKTGYFGLFIGGNEISGILVGLSPIVLSFLSKSKSYILKVLIYLELLVVIFLVGTKTLFIGIILTLFFLLYKHLRYAYVVMNEKKSKIPYIIGLIVIVICVFLLPKSPMIKNFKTTLDYYKVNGIKETIKIENIDNVVFSKRLTNIYNVGKVYIKGNGEQIIYGIGKTGVMGIKDIEIDIFDILFSVGIFGTIIYILLILFTTRFNILRDSRYFALSLFILMSIFSGHILIKPMVSIYIALLYLLEKNTIKIEKKKILLVSNMYPSKKSKHYGVFVQNVEGVLKDNGFEIDRVVMEKQNEKILKLFSYIIFYIKTIVKTIFNNYDYIYVHFISHSSLGAVFAKRTSKDVKLILNAHGNDIIADKPFEVKNEKRSKKYLKYADKVVVPSKYFKDLIINKYNIDEDKVFVYPSGGVNTSKFIKIDRKEALKNSNLDDKYSYIGYVSRLDKDKGYDVFLKAIRYLIDNNKITNEKFIVVGAGAEQNIFNEMVKELDLKDYLEIRNMVSPDELVSIYNSLDIFVFPTYRKSESLGLVGLEAMSCETLVVASNNYGPTDYIRDKKNGLFFKPKDHVDLANKIIEMKNLNNEERNKMKRKARETAISFDSINTKNKIIDVFK
ncbi:MAG: O-antigen ligase family protein [Bacilli bacterium]|nr:O-antigen ligase family protein [Bacilli bacterium]